MTSQSSRIYTYKITFEEVPYYYYGVHKERKYNEYYMGSPKTNKWCWELYTPKKQLLEFFDYTDEGWLEANKVEKKLINPFYNADKWCLNESCGGTVSLKINRETGSKCGKFAYENKIGIFSMSLEEKQEIARKVGLKSKEDGKGIFSIDKETHIENCKRGGKTQGNLSKINKLGFFALSKEEMSENGKKGGSKGGKRSKELGVGVCGRSKEKMTEDGKKGGKISGEKHKKNKTGICGRSKEKMTEDGKKGGKASGENNKKNKTGICGRSKEKMTEDGKKGGKISSSQRWMCLNTGFISNAGSLTTYQKKRGIDPSQRIRIYD
jgi:general stress protein YciG